IDFGIHQRLNSSGLLHAWKMRRAGASNVRVTTSSRSDLRSTVVAFFMAGVSLSLVGSLGALIAFQFLDHPVQLVEARVPELAVSLDPRCRLFEAAWAELAGAHAPDLLCGDEPRLLQHADVLLHAREGHVEFVGEVGNRRVGTAELL